MIIIRKILSAGLTYLYQATFTADDQGFIDNQSLDTTDEGVETGTFLVAEVDGAVAISSNELALTAQSTPAINDCGIYGQDAIANQCGLAMYVKQGNYGYLQHGLSETIDYCWNEAVGGLINSGDPQVGNNGPRFNEAGTTVWEVVSVCGGFDTSKLPVTNGDTIADFRGGSHLYAKHATHTSGQWWLVGCSISGTQYTGNRYPGVSAWNANTNVAELYVPDPSSWAASTLQMEPDHLSAFSGGSDGDGLNASYTPEIGSWDNDNAELDGSGNAKFGTAGECVFTYTADGYIFSEMTMPASGTTPGGFVYRYSDTSNYWYQRYTGGGGTNSEIVEVNSGTPTVRASSAETLSASTTYTVWVNYMGDSWQESGIGLVRQTSYSSTNTFNLTSTGVGLKDEGTANFKWAQFTAMDRYDASLSTDLDAIGA